jgi:drug/metabolite transporter (DMT)-like permease
MSNNDTNINKNDYGSINIEKENINNNTNNNKFISNLLPKYDNNSYTWIIFFSCCIVGPLNFVLYKIMYSSFDDTQALFVSQCVNFQYVIIGGVFFYFINKQNLITQEMKDLPKKKFLIMGLLDCIAGCLSALGSPHTSGSSQQLLNQALIPLTIFISTIVLHTKSSNRQNLGCLFIFSGVLIVLLPSLLGNGNQYSQPMSMFIYFLSNIPLAISYIYKEYAFKNLSVHVIFLTQWVSIFQFILGFLVLPLQAIPGMGSAGGVELNQIIPSFIDGFYCFLGTTPICSSRKTFLLLTGYCFVNFIFNTLGLYLVKSGSATLNSISYSIILPLTTLMFSMPLLGIYQEPFQLFTIIGLIAVLVGFVIWKSEQILPDDDDIDSLIEYEEKLKDNLENDNLIDNVSIPKNKSFGNTDSFHERIIVPILAS